MSHRWAALLVLLGLTVARGSWAALPAGGGQPPAAAPGAADPEEHAEDAAMFEAVLGRTHDLPKPGTPEYDHALDLVHQAVTMAKIRTLGTNLFSWLLNQDELGIGKPIDVLEIQRYPLVTVEQIRKILVPTYMEALDERDGWGRPIEMRLNLVGLKGKQVMCLRSPGADGKFSSDSYKSGTFLPDDVDEDIVWCDGFFIRKPQKVPDTAGTAPAH